MLDVAAPVIIFDVNETLLDVRAMGPRFAAEFGDTTLLSEWFSNLLGYSLEVTVTGDYRPFDELAANALVVTARRHGFDPSSSAVAGIISGITELPAHGDVEEGLEMLKAAGFALATLTNSRHAAVEAQLNYAGIAHHFDRVMSVEEVRQFKPAPATYYYAAEQCGVAVDELMLIASHDWDVNGAILAGASAAFLERANATRAPHNVIPEVTATDLPSLVAKLVDNSNR